MSVLVQFKANVFVYTRVTSADMCCNLEVLCDCVLLPKLVGLVNLEGWRDSFQFSS